ncbi:heavy-metal-associated domain-containing protein [Hansschlegelia sp. KR7-227]|uniref:heavy-metal-associated domain-containing protein n=1 Tax=Hansschlegelia sp. KR7-227 TaxID=3400914 RepID=UPI003C1048B6
MISLDVDGMTCDGCARAVERALVARDPAAKVAVSRTAGRVDIATTLSVEDAVEAVERAGYDAKPSAA